MIRKKNVETTRVIAVDVIKNIILKTVPQKLNIARNVRKSQESEQKQMTRGIKFVKFVKHWWNLKSIQLPI